MRSYKRYLACEQAHCLLLKRCFEYTVAITESPVWSTGFLRKRFSAMLIFQAWATSASSEKKVRVQQSHMI